MTQGEEHRTAGRISKPFGLQGELLVALYDTFPYDFDRKEPLFVVIDGLAVPLFCDRFQRRGKSGALVVFADFETEHRASELVGMEFFLSDESDVPEDEEPDDGLVYLEDMVGLKAIVDETYEGTIVEFIDGENPLFLITLDGREVFVPAVDEFITEMDIEAGVIRFELPDGLIGLND